MRYPECWHKPHKVSTNHEYLEPIVKHGKVIVSCCLYQRKQRDFQDAPRRPNAYNYPFHHGSNVTPHHRLARCGRAVVVQALVRRLYLFYSSVVIFQNFIITPFTVSVYEFIGEVPWMLL